MLLLPSHVPVPNTLRYVNLTSFEISAGMTPGREMRCQDGGQQETDVSSRAENILQLPIDMISATGIADPKAGNSSGSVIHVMTHPKSA